MKNRFIYIKGLSIIILGLLFSCQKTENSGNDNDLNQLKIAANLEDLIQLDPRGYANTFFREGDEIILTVVSSNPQIGEQDFTYTYNANGIFVGNPGYLFTLDDHYIQSLTAIWPKDGPENGTFESDQREYENYRKSDRLEAVATAEGVMPTDVPVPLHFEHQNCLLEFELVGQNTSGLEITELLIELEVGGVPTACYAYCGNENGRASFLLNDGTVIESQEGYLIGTIPGMSGDRYTIILSDINITLRAGKRYLVTLTPRGYDMDMYVFIASFNEVTGENETGIGVPFHNPSEGEDGDYIIHTPVQLITMSYVVRHYTGAQTPDWPSLTYTLTDDFVMTAEYAAKYIPIPRSLFTGEVIFNGESIETISYDGDQVLELFSNE